MGPSREACDRCHYMKTRCIRAPGSHVCVRCTRVGSSCNYSPPRPTGRPLKQRKPKGASDKSQSSVGSFDSFDINECRDTRNDTQISRSDQMAEPMVAIDTADFFPSTDHGADSAMSFIENFTFDDTSTLIGSSYDSGMSSLHSNPSILSTSSLQATSISPPDAGPGQDSCRPCSIDNVANLLDLQARLARLAKAFSHGASTSDNVEDLYRTNADIVSALDGLEASQLHDNTGGNDASLPGSIALLLLPTCYYSLLHNFELLGDLLYVEWGHDSTSTDDTLPHARRIELPVLSISVGTVQVAMPRKEVVEMNLQLLSRMVQQLREAMNRCFVRFGMDPKSIKGLRGGAETLFKKAIADLGKKEDVLVDTLRRRGFANRNKI